jgi:outer membrane receptor protein involved in Fe transport
LPRLAFIWKAIPDHDLKLSYGKAFFAPGNNHKYDYAFGYFGNPDLKPQTIQTYELTRENLFEKWFHCAVGAYHSKVADVIALFPNQNPSFYNSGTIVFKGLELEGRWYVSKKLNI